MSLSLVCVLHASLSFWQSFRGETGGYSNSVASTSPAVFQHSAPASIFFYSRFGVEFYGLLFEKQKGLKHGKVKQIKKIHSKL